MAKYMRAMYVFTFIDVTPSLILAQTLKLQASRVKVLLA